MKILWLLVAATFAACVVLGCAGFGYAYPGFVTGSICGGMGLVTLVAVMKGF